MGLIKKIADGICKLLAMQGIIQKEDLELYRYGIENGIIVVLNFLTSVVIGIITGRLGVVLVFLCFYVPLRTYGGGVHLKSKWLCYLLSNLILLIPIYTYDAGMKLLSKAGYVLLLLPAVIVIFVLCPVESVNKRLDKDERKYYRRALYQCVGIVCAGSFLCIGIGSLLICRWCELSTGSIIYGYWEGNIKALHLNVNV